jgi:hypothetical protein
MKRILLFLVLSSSINFAQNAGETGYSFLKLGFGARNIALSDFGVVGTYDVSSVNYNPALVNKTKSGQVLLGHNSGIADLSTQVIGASFKFLSLPFTFSLNTTTIPDFERRTRPGDVESTFDVHYFFSGISTGFDIYENISFGFTGKYLYESIYSDESGGFGFDLGLHATDVIENLNLGFSLRNLGSVDELRNEKTELPVDLRLGASYNLPIESIESDLILISGFQKYTAVDNSHIHLASELVFREFISLRAGYVTGYDGRDLSAGLGIYWKKFNFDYAFTNYSFDLGSAHTISLMYSFN